MTATTISPATSHEDENRKPSSEYGSFVRPRVKEEMIKMVLRKKLAKQRHVVLPKAIDPSYLDSLFPQMLKLFDPQTVNYNGGIGQVPQWKISCYLEVMNGGVPTTHPNLPLLDLFHPLLTSCNQIFVDWYRQQHACNSPRTSTPIVDCRRIMTFITRYTPAPGEQALLKHVDGAGKVDGSIVVALPVDRWSAPEEENAFEGGGLTFWDGPRQEEIRYDTRSGDLALIDRAVWHQANPITKGTRWALVIFYKVIRDE
uniref:Fe2OG dioxygenase domain-containing protein n=1 Tax=Entomoneis paludosa TaxID=265537 RepID=A0A7S2VDP8_9STRA